MFKKRILIRVRSKIIQMSIGSLLCESTLRIQDCIKIGNSFLIHLLKSAQELLPGFHWNSFLIWVGEHKSQESIHLILALALVANNFIAGFTSHCFRRYDDSFRDDLSAELTDQSTFAKLRIFINGQLHLGNHVKDDGGLFLSEEAVLNCLQKLSKNDGNSLFF